MASLSYPSYGTSKLIKMIHLRVLQESGSSAVPLSSSLLSFFPHTNATLPSSHCPVWHSICRAQDCPHANQTEHHVPHRASPRLGSDMVELSWRRRRRRRDILTDWQLRLELEAPAKSRETACPGPQPETYGPCQRSRAAALLSHCVMEPREIFKHQTLKSS